MSSGLYSGVSGLALGVGLYKGVGGLWGGASGLIDGFGGFNPAAVLFGAGEPGGWYDPSDLSTMFQDTAGTVPVTATGQTVARINDKSGRGNHLTQATAASRPIYGIEPFGGRRNLLVRTEEFDNAAWTKSNITTTPNAITAPDGTLTADKLEVTTTAGAQAYQTLTTLGSGSYTYSIYAKQGSGALDSNVFGVRNNTTATNAALLSINYSTGVVTQTVGAGATATDVGNGWWRIVMPFTLVATLGDSIRFYAGNSGAAETAGEFLYPWGAQLETGSLATAYQRVTDQWNVTEAGVPSVSYVQYDGTDDGFVSPTITPGIDKAQVFAGVRVIGTSAGGMILETSGDIGGNNGALNLAIPNASPFGGRGFRSKGTVQGTADTANSAYTAPITQVLTGLGDIAGDAATLRVNGVQAATGVTDQGTGNYLAYPLYVGRRGGTTLPFNGRMYQMIVRFGANLDAATIAATEAFVETKTGAIPPLNATLNLDFLANAYEAGI